MAVFCAALWQTCSHPLERPHSLPGNSPENEPDLPGFPRIMVNITPKLLFVAPCCPFNIDEPVDMTMAILSDKLICPDKR
ncbi:hypothetical protein DERP_014814 [Dermatophagoides pteronyssinus]|uniref:Uncharacterized protein n=1 Tax=Dermatophagoides pteronyssinus TaxID=6956 RepID=A0ABQ8J2M7_DERPT|nr:hypothetical protein DERP_014814 [Dermatophagoides pteronyssinus]